MTRPTARSIFCIILAENRSSNLLYKLFSVQYVQYILQNIRPCQEEEDEHHAAPEGHPFPVEARFDAEDALEVLIWRVEKHRVGGDEVDQEQDLHSELDGAVTQDTGDTLSEALVLNKT